MKTTATEKQIGRSELNRREIKRESPDMSIIMIAITVLMIMGYLVYTKVKTP